LNHFFPGEFILPDPKEVESNAHNLCCILAISMRENIILLSDTCHRVKEIVFLKPGYKNEVL